MKKTVTIILLLFMAYYSKAQVKVIKANNRDLNKDSYVLVGNLTVGKGFP